MSTTKSNSPDPSFKEVSYLPLHNHSHFSFLAGVPDIPQLVKRAKDLGYPALALTDTNNMGGLILFIEECRRQNIKPICGIEWQHPSDPQDQLVLLAKNAKGYAELCSLSTKFFCSKTKSPLYQSFDKHYKNLFIFSSYPNTLMGLLNSPMQPELFGELICTDKESRSRSKEIENLCSLYNIKLLATEDSYFLDRHDWNTHKILRSISTHIPLDKLPAHHCKSPRAYLHKPDEVEWTFQRKHDALKNTLYINHHCIDDLMSNNWIMPKVKDLKDDTPQAKLRELSTQGIHQLYSQGPNLKKALKQMEKELKIIHDKGYDSYFLMIRQLRLWANKHLSQNFRQPKDCTTLRGSAANSIVLYSIGGSDLDPIKYNLYFERFLNPDRKSPPDVDLDFAWDERDEVLKYAFDEWGRENVAVMCTTITFKWKSAFRQVAKAYGYKDTQITSLVRWLGKGHFYPGSPSLKSTEKHKKLNEISYYAQLILGKPYYLSQHCGGIVVTNDPISNHVACQPSRSGKNARPITQIDMHNGIDYLGLIKFDLLGNGSLAVLRDALNQISDQNFEDPEVWDLEKCFNDSKVKKMMADGGTRGVFYLESPAQSRLNKKAWAESFDEIGITSSLIRPAGTAYTEKFIERHREAKENKEASWSFLHPSLEEILGDTHDVCVFQEDIIKICVEIAGLSFAQADRVRKMMNSLHEGVPDDYEKVSKLFQEGCIENKAFEPQAAAELWERVQSFQGFSFCKSHSLSYAQLSFQCAYLKAHFPAQFLSAVAANHHGFYHYSIYFDEARRLGINILPVCVNTSSFKHFGKDNWIRFGLMHLRGLNNKHLNNLITIRQQDGPYVNFVDFFKRCSFFHKNEIEVLILVGALDCFGLNRPQLHELWQRLLNPTPKNQLALGFYEEIVRKQNIQPLSFSERCLHELHHLGYIVSGNVLDMLQHHPGNRGATPINQVPFFVNQKLKVFGIPIARRPHRIGHSGKSMLFLTLQDKTETLDLVAWPEVYQKHKRKLHEPVPMEIYGTVKEEFGTYTLEIIEIKTPRWAPTQNYFSARKRSLQNQEFESLDNALNL